MSQRSISNGSRGRPRSEETEQAILKAAGAMVAELGLAEMTIEGVAERAGVGKASIYRRWPTKGALAFDAVADTYLATQPMPDTGSLEGDLRKVADNWVASSNRPRGGRMLAHLIAGVQSDPALAVTWRERFVKRVRSERMAIVERAIARREIPAGSDADLILDMFFGPLYHRYLNGHLPVDVAFGADIARMVAAAAIGGAAVPDPRRVSSRRPR